MVTNAVCQVERIGYLPASRPPRPSQTDRWLLCCPSPGLEPNTPTSLTLISWSPRCLSQTPVRDTWHGEAWPSPPGRQERQLGLREAAQWLYDLGYVTTRF